MPNMTVADILKIHGKYVESKQFVSLVAEKMSIDERQAYRKIKESFQNNEIKKFQLPDRSVLYGLAEFGPLSSEKVPKVASARTVNFNDAFLFDCFKKIDKISMNAHDQSPIQVFRELMFLIATFPKELKDKIKPLQDQAIGVVTANGKRQWEPKYKQFQLFEDRLEDPDFELKAVYYPQVLWLIDNVSSILHEYSTKKGR
jgi:hypothetical protein